MTLLDVKEMAAVLYDEGDGAMLDIVCDLVAGMSDRCGEILTKFYYEEKDLEHDPGRVADHRQQERPQDQEV